MLLKPFVFICANLQKRKKKHFALFKLTTFEKGAHNLKSRKQLRAKKETGAYGHIWSLTLASLGWYVLVHFVRDRRFLFRFEHLHFVTTAMSFIRSKHLSIVTVLYSIECLALMCKSDIVSEICCFLSWKSEHCHQNLLLFFSIMFGDQVAGYNNRVASISDLTQGKKQQMRIMEEDVSLQDFGIHRLHLCSWVTSLCIVALWRVSRAGQRVYLQNFWSFTSL